MNKLIKKSLSLALTLVMLLSAAPLSAEVFSSADFNLKASAESVNAEGILDLDSTLEKISQAAEAVSEHSAVIRKSISAQPLSSEAAELYLKILYSELPDTLPLSYIFKYYTISIIASKFFIKNFGLSDDVTITVGENDPFVEEKDGNVYLRLDSPILKYYEDAVHTYMGTLKDFEHELTITEPVEAIASGSFIYNDVTEKVILPETVKVLHPDAFYSALALKEVNIPDGVTRIESGVFCDCFSLEKIVLPEKLEYIGTYAFANCLSLKEIEIPASVKTVEREAFSNCFALEKVTIHCPGSAFKENETFAYCYNLSELTLTNKDVIPVKNNFYQSGLNVYEGFADDVKRENEIQGLLNIYYYYAPEQAPDGLYEEYVAIQNKTDAVNRLDSGNFTVYAHPANEAKADFEKIGATFENLPGHELTLIEETPATCTEKGSKAHCSCDKCGELACESIDIIPHRDENADEICDDCGSQEAYIITPQIDDNICEPYDNWTKRIAIKKDEPVYARFDCTETRNYVLKAYNSFNAQLLDEDFNIISDDFIGNIFSAEAGKTYYFKFLPYGGSAYNGYFYLTSYHDVSQWTTVREATCSIYSPSTVYEGKCSRCNMTVSKYDSPKESPEHKYEWTNVAPTCDTMGFEGYLCKDCGMTSNNRDIHPCHTDKNGDNVCDECNDTVSAKLTAGKSVKIDVDGKDYYEFTFTPENSGIYNFKATAFDMNIQYTHIYVYHENGIELEALHSGEEIHLEKNFVLTEGETYKIKFIYQDEVSNSFTFKADCLHAADWTYIEDATATDPAKKEGVCIFCSEKITVTELTGGHCDEDGDFYCDFCEKDFCTPIAVNEEKTVTANEKEAYFRILHNGDMGLNYTVECDYTYFSTEIINSDSDIIDMTDKLYENDKEYILRVYDNYNALGKVTVKLSANIQALPTPYNKYYSNNCYFDIGMINGTFNSAINCQEDVTFLFYDENFNLVKRETSPYDESNSKLFSTDIENLNVRYVRLEKEVDAYLYFTSSCQNHDFSTWSAVTPPTCTTPGEGYAMCTKCGTTTGSLTEIPAMHWGGTASCSALAVCSSCGESYGNYNSKVHLNTEAIDGFAGSCTKPYLTNGVRCTDCDTVISKQEYDYGVHDFKAVITKPTCTEGGYTTYTCKECGTEKTANKKEPLGHTGCSKGGTCSSEVNCKRCGIVVGEINPDKHLNIITLEAVEPTCTKTGLTEGSKCTDCGTVLVSQQEIEEKGHSYKETVVAPTCTENGYTICTCEACGDSITIKETPATGVHTDKNSDGKCDSCSEAVETENGDNNEEELSFFEKLIQSIRDFFNRISEFFRNLF